MPRRHALQCGDPVWTGMLRQAFVDVLANAGPEGKDLNFSVSEEYDNPPPPSPDSHTSGWTCRIVDGQVAEFEFTPSRDVDIYVRADHALAQELASFLVAGDPKRLAEFEARSAQAVSDGELRLEGDLSAGRPWLMWGVHDTMARAMSANKSGVVS